MNKIAQLAPSARAEIFGETANRLGLPEALVEKDFWPCWMLAQIFSIEPFRGTLLFKGGTSLSKIFGVIQRFSEDIDLAVDYSMLGFTGTRDPHAPGLFRTRQGALLDEMLPRANRYGRRLMHAGPISKVIFCGTCARDAWTCSVPKVRGGSSWTVRTRILCISSILPAFAGQLAYIAPQVVLELGTHAEFIPRGEFTIRSFAAAEFPDLFGQADIPVTSLLAKRTFWEKATILHAEYHRPPDKTLPARYSRHYYDVAMMAAQPVKHEAFQDLDLLAAVVKHKQTFYPSAWAQYPLAVPGTFKFAPAEARIASLRQDYREMAVMIFGDPPTFDQIIETLVALEKELNALERNT